MGILKSDACTSESGGRGDGVGAVGERVTRGEGSRGIKRDQWEGVELPAPHSHWQGEAGGGCLIQGIGGWGLGGRGPAQRGTMPYSPPPSEPALFPILRNLSP